MRIVAWGLMLAAVGSAAPIEQMKRQTVRIDLILEAGGRKQSGSGTGFVVSDRHVVTNWHVCCMTPEQAGLTQQLFVSTGKDQHYAAKVLWSSVRKDLAVLETERALGQPAVLFAERKHLTDGQAVWAIGYPGASNLIAEAAERFTPTITQGIISKFFEGRVAKEQQPIRLIQTTAALNPGNSGGPLFDDCGSVAGINRAKALTVVLTSRGLERVPLADGVNWTVESGELLEELSRLRIGYKTVGSACVAGVPAVSSSGLPMGTTVVLLAAAGAGLWMVRRRPSTVTAPSPPAAPRPVPAKRARLALEGMSGEYRGKKLPLDSVGLVIGRDPAVSSVVFPGDAVSKRHCEVRMEGEAVVVTDAWSSNGTFLASGERMEPGRAYKMTPGQSFYLAQPGQAFRVVEAGE